MYLPHFPFNGAPSPQPDSVDTLNMIDLVLRNRDLLIRVREKRPVRINVQVLAARKVFDRFSGRFILEFPRFPHCVPAGNGTPGGTVEVTFDGMRPNREIHALLGPNEVLRGIQTSASGTGRISLPIPAGTPRGNHLVAVGDDGLALTADCTVAVT